MLKKNITLFLICIIFSNCKQDVKENNVLLKRTTLVSEIEITNAKELVDNLKEYNILKIINDINLGELPPTFFPLVIPKNCQIIGNYDFFNNSNGTTIYFPYLFKNHSSCKIDKLDNYLIYKAFAFDMKDSSVFSHIKLKGAKVDIKDWRYFSLICDCKPCTDDIDAKEGLSSGIFVSGKECLISDCEIFGFNYFGIEVVPDKLNKGNFYCYNNYIHHNRHLGYGYGIWLAGDRSTNLNCIVTNPCGATLTKNSTDQDQNAFIKNCLFFKNKHDIAGSGGRNSYFIDQCTFQATGDYNIDRHGGGMFVCNPNCVTKICDSTNKSIQSNNKIITDVGGNITSITNCIFYKHANTIGITYPNINSCNGIDEGKVIVSDNIFKDYNKIGKTGQIQIADVADYTNWNGDSNIQIINNKFIYPIINTNNINIENGDTSGKITVGERLKFKSLYNKKEYQHIWNFGDTNEIRNNNNPIYKFLNIGMTDVTLLCVDKSYKADDLITKSIIVKPRNTKYILVCWLKDTYIGSFFKKVNDNCYVNSGTDYDTTLTGFVKYISINGKDIWVDDIAGDEGWQKVQIELELDSTKTHTLEVGVKAIKKVNGNVVRGFNFFIDDIYINAKNGDNIILNGGFEIQTTPISGNPTIWKLFGENSITSNYKSAPCLAQFNYTLNQVTSKITTDEPRSGLRSYSSYIRPFTEIPYTYNGKKYNLSYYDGLSYNIGKYRYITQTFKLK